MIEAVFSLARKVSPCVIFIDEIDGFLSTRNDSDMAHVTSMKVCVDYVLLLCIMSSKNIFYTLHTILSIQLYIQAKMLECWDGLRTPPVTAVEKSKPNNNWVLVIGATK
jgi:SpoVK/Ycf46/Vps4 family AAA+-type ATPase